MYEFLMMEVKEWHIQELTDIRKLAQDSHGASKSVNLVTKIKEELRNEKTKFPEACLPCSKHLSLDGG